MAVAIVQTGMFDSDVTATDTATVVMPAAVTAGNLLMANVSYFVSGAGPAITPTGWSIREDHAQDDAGNMVFERVAQSGDGDTFVFETTGVDFVAVTMIEVSGQHTVSYLNQEGNAGNSATTHTTASVTPSVTGCLAIIFLATDIGGFGGADAATIGAGWTIQERPYPSFHPAYLATRDALTSDTVTAINATFSNLQDGPNASVIVLIAPTAAAATFTPKVMVF